MKQHVKTWAVAIVLLSSSFTALAQAKSPTIPKWVSGKGYWVAESNIHHPLQHIIWFYDNDGLLMYKETLTGTRLNVKRTKVKMKLKKVLEEIVLAWEKKKIPEEDKHYVMLALR
jgi:hypothetical protein